MGAGILIHDLATNPAVQKDASSFLQKTFLSMGREFQKTEAGKGLWNVLHTDYLPTLDRTITHIGDLQNKSTGTGKLQSYEIYNKGRNVASEVAFGKNQSLIAAYLHAADLEGGHIHAQNLADNMAMILQDNDTKPVFKGKKITEFRDVSRTKYNAVKDPEHGEYLGKFLNTKPVYESKTPLERTVSDYEHTTLAPFAALGHLGTFANALPSIPFRALSQAVSDTMTHPDSLKTLLHVSGVMQEDVINTVKQQVDYKSGRLAKYLPGSYADMLNRAIHMPGLRQVRNLQITMFGSAGMHTAHDMAAILAKDPTNPRALKELTDMHIDPHDVIKQKGKLSQQQLQDAIYHFVNNHVFLHPEMGRAFTSGQNVWTRQASMFHAFTVAQGRFLRNEATKAWQLKGSNPVAFARLIGALAVAFPAMGFGIKQLEDMGRGTWSYSDMKGQMDNLEFKNGAKASVEEYLDDQAHVGAFAIAGSYIRGASRNSLSNLFVGPIGNVAGRVGQDTAQLITTGKATPLGRDVLSYGLPLNLGKIASHYILPTWEDKKKHGGGSMTLRMKGMKGLSNN